MEFVALVRKEPGSVFCVEFPDLPGCVTTARTLERAHERAAEVLDLHVEDMLANGEALPWPSSIALLMSDPDNLDAVAIAVRI